MCAVNDGATNYIRARDLAVILGGRTAYQGATDKAPFNTNMAYAKYTAPTYVDGKAVNLDAIQIEYNGGGYTYYKLRDLGQALGFIVGYDNATDTVFIETNKPYDLNN